MPDNTTPKSAGTLIMVAKFMSTEWIRLVGKQWDTHPEIQKDLKNFNATWEYHPEERGHEGNGAVDRFSPPARAGHFHGRGCPARGFVGKNGLHVEGRAILA